MHYDLVIRGGTIIDGTGDKPYQGDVAINGRTIAAVGQIDGTGREEIDAGGRLVTPGFVDVHTHYDGQATWEHTLAPSSNHGVTTIVGGNCGVGFAPCRSDDRDKLITVMEGVEDIPEVVMAAGIPWNWESFPEYLDALDAREFDIDIAMQVAHSPLRVFVMGDRGADLEPSTEIDRARMAALVTEAINAGAIGVSTSRSLNHRAKDGRLAPSVSTAKEEVLALAKGLGASNGGVFQIITEMEEDPADEMALVERIAETSGRPVSFSLAETMENPDSWRSTLDALAAMNDRGRNVTAQVFPRPIGVMMGLDLSLNPILTRPSYAAIKDLPLEERVAIMRDPAFKEKVLAETPVPDPQPVVNMLVGAVDKLFGLGAEPEYMPDESLRLDNRAAALGKTSISLAYDLMLEQDGHGLLYLPSANFATGTPASVREMMAHRDTVLGLGDGGAHYGMICDAGFPTFSLAYWCRDAAEDDRFPVEWIVRELTSRPAGIVNMRDRGLVKQGYKADLNVIDFDRLKLESPRPTYDLPSGGRRLRQLAEGIDATIVSGVVTYRDGVSTGELPGRLVRGDGYAPLAATGS